MVSSSFGCKGDCKCDMLRFRSLIIVVSLGCKSEGNHDTLLTNPLKTETNSASHTGDWWLLGLLQVVVRARSRQSGTHERVF
jgi:hypothetical protein